MTPEARLAIAQSRLELLGEPVDGEPPERTEKRERCRVQAREAQEEIDLRRRNTPLPTTPPSPPLAYKDDD